MWNPGHTWDWKPFNLDMPPHIPKRFDEKRELFHILENPVAWYMGLMTKFAIRPSDWLWEELDRRARGLGMSLKRDESYRNLTAGIHVRSRFDPEESPRIHVGVYLQVVEEWFKQVSHQSGLDMVWCLVLAVVGAAADLQ